MAENFLILNNGQIIDILTFEQLVKEEKLTEYLQK